jgi:hypothetical protein
MKLLIAEAIFTNGLIEFVKTQERLMDGRLSGIESCQQNTIFGRLVKISEGYDFFRHVQNPNRMRREQQANPVMQYFQSGRQIKDLIRCSFVWRNCAT